MNLSKYNLANLKLAAKNPDVLIKEIRRIYFNFQYGNGTNIMKEDWDNLILLDACRYDAFQEVNFIDGRLESRISKGSTSKEFLRKNFSNQELHDTVYITANPYAGHIEKDVFHAMITLLDEWDEDLQTVRPSTIVENVKNIYDEYDDKRIIIHFMQPHQPYLGAKSNEINNKISDVQKVGGWNGTLRGDNKDLKETNGVKPLYAPKNPEIDVTNQDVWEAYCETLEIVLNSVNELINIMDGKTVISSDHGELIGEQVFPFTKRHYGHHYGSGAYELRIVPWFIVESTNRRDIVVDPPEIYDSIDENNLNSKLEALGYK